MGWEKRRRWWGGFEERRFSCIYAFIFWFSIGICFCFGEIFLGVGGGVVELLVVVLFVFERN